MRLDSSYFPCSDSLMIAWVQDIGFTQSPLALEFGNHWGGKEGRSSSAAASVAFGETHLIPATVVVVHVS